ncbi:MAG: hypothetical protein IJV63_04280 [Bacteroidales bacterium]|nr:hypothetical protein [Bacteroidales bacterium]
MMRMTWFKYLLSAGFLLALGSCSKETELPAPEPEKTTIHYSASVEQVVDQTRSVVGEDMQYRFEQGDRIYLESTDGKMYGFLSLAVDGGVGKTVAAFEGELTCVGDFRPSADTEVNLTLIGPADEIHTISEGKVTETVYTDKWAPTLSEAIRRFSDFTGSGKFGPGYFKLKQNSSFLVCNLSFDAVKTPSGTSVTATLYNAYSSAPAQLHQVSIPVATVDGDVELNYVAAFKNTQLSDARMIVSQTGKEDVLLKMADQTLAASSFYTFQRATYLQNYFTIEATEADTKVTFNYADAADGLQYSRDGYEWKNYKKADGKITIPSAGGKLYFRGKRSTFNCWDNNPLVSVDGNKPCYVYGDLMFLLCDSKYKPRTEMADFAFQKAFKNCTWLRLDPEKKLRLTATTLSRGCYFELFSGCTGIDSLGGVALPASTVALAPRCFDSMFYGCTGITTVPGKFLPWTTLAMGCYRKMFSGCTNLETVPSGLLPATTLAPCCYMNMFFNCFKLTAGPDLLATEAKSGCYFAMFRHCKAIKYVKCLIVLTEEQRKGISNPGSGYDDDAEPSPNNLDNWEVVSAWSVFNKWLNDVPNNNNCYFYKNAAMTYPKNDGVGGIPDKWNVVDN